VAQKHVSRPRDPPDRPVSRRAVPADSLARLTGERLTRALGQPVVVENKPGAGGNIGMGARCEAAPAAIKRSRLAPAGNLTVSFRRISILLREAAVDPEKDYARSP